MKLSKKNKDEEKEQAKPVFTEQVSRSSTVGVHGDGLYASVRFMDDRMCEVESMFIGSHDSFLSGVSLNKQQMYLLVELMRKARLI